MHSTGGFTSQLRQDFEDAENQGRSLLSVMRELAQLSFGPIDLDARIPDPGVRQQQIDDQIAAQARGGTDTPRYTSRCRRTGQPIHRAAPSEGGT